jgi:hypothetical protein
MKFSLFSRNLSKEKAQFILTRSSDEKVFIAKNGMAIHSLFDLKEALATMSDETYEHHANEIKNDFSAWINDVHDDDEFAKVLSTAQDKNHALQLLDKRLAYLKRMSLRG